MNKSKAENIISTIPPSGSDDHLREWGFDLLEEYFEMINSAGFRNDQTVFDFATGSGRMTALLTRLGFDVITADLTSEQRQDALKRITKDYENKVRFIQLNLENLPFETGSLQNIECVDTVHHLEDPIKCISELVRAHSSSGTLLLADFNEEGFDVMDKIHRIKYGKDHTRGNFSWEEIKSLLRKNYASLEESETRLNKVLIARNKS